MYGLVIYHDIHGWCGDLVLRGIDVSVYQGYINWNAVAQSGIEFAGIKATEGLQFKDPQFVRNWQQSKAHDVRRIAYHFFHPDVKGEDQADFFHSYVRDSGHFQSGDCAMLDIEVTNGIGTPHLIECAEAFVRQFLKTTTCGLYIYTGSWFWDGVLGSPRSTILGKCPLWEASWGPHYGQVSNWPTGPALWQWSASLRVPGIVGNVDADRFLGIQKQYDLLAEFGGRK